MSSFLHWFNTDRVSAGGILLGVVATLVAAWWMIRSANRAAKSANDAARSANQTAEAMRGLEFQRRHCDLGPKKITVDRQKLALDCMSIFNEDDHTFLIMGLFMGGFTESRDDMPQRALFEAGVHKTEVMALGPGQKVIARMPAPNLRWRLRLAFEPLDNGLKCPCGNDEAPHEASATEVHGHWMRDYPIPRKAEET